MGSDGYPSSTLGGTSRCLDVVVDCGSYSECTAIRRTECIFISNY